MTEWKGLPGARGQAMGRAVILKETEYSLERRQIRDADQEVKRLESAREDYGKELKELYEEAKVSTGEESAKIFLAYKVMNDDDIFFRNLIKRVRAEMVNMDYALEEEKKTVSQVFLNMEDPYMKERGADIENVCDALIKRLRGVRSPLEQLKGIQEDFVIIAEDLTPADTVKLDKKFLRGFVTERGGKTSHTVILAKSLGIPAIVGAEGIMETAEKGERIYIDGDTGVIAVRPDEGIIREYEKQKQRLLRQEELLAQAKSDKAVTTDGYGVDICVNSGDRDSISLLNMEVCDGVGLFRTEFLYMAQNGYPSEELQYEVYRELAQKAGGKEAVIRTLDIGGDKQVDYMGLPEEENPFLGYRAIRICLDKPKEFLVQLKAILRASAFGKVSVMFPMIVNLEELRKAKEAVEAAKRELDGEGIGYDKNIKVGIMIETPAAVLLSDKLAKEADFFSVGTNDLIQYITATDRMNEHTQYLYRSCNLSVLRAMKMIADNAHGAGIRVGICGEAASDEKMTFLWLGLGIDELSMVPSQTARIKYIIQNTSQKEAKEITDTVFRMDTADEVEAYLIKALERFEEIL